MKKGVSVIIPCRNEKEYIEQCVKSLVDNDYPKDNLEIIIVDGNSNDGTIDIINELIAKYPFIRIINNPKQITPVALNLGIKNANFEYVMIAGAHALYSSNYISSLVDNIKKLSADGVGGMLITKVKNETYKSMSIAAVLSNKLGVGNSLFRIGVKNAQLVDTVPFGLYKKELFKKVGYYDERLIRNHDIELSKRMIAAGCKIYLIPDLYCTYYARETFHDIAKNNYRNGYWNILTTYYTKSFHSLSIRHFVPLVFLLSLIFPVIFSFFFSSVWIYLFFVLFLLYNFFLIIASFLENNKKTKFKYLFFAFYILHFSYGMGSFIALFRIKTLFKEK
ncbi:MAG: glycosyltransferase family 2 protein [Bacteroidetes bacterium]|nr:MAG: glycosyltransferase family 2 protein [Bacteroidota bacterium]